MSSNMISGVYGITMQWSPEQSQWAEQHYDITSTTRSPGHKIEVLRDPRLTGPSSAAAYQHSWANDDISALTASNLLKRYAERYSAILDLPCDGGVMGYPDTTISVSVSGPGVVNGAPPLLNGRKLEAEPWLDNVYPPLGCVPELLPKAPLSVSDVSVSVCSSPVIGSGSLPEPCFSSSSCNSQTGNQEYSSAPYSTPYLQPVGTYGGSLFHPTPSHASLVPTYSTNTSPNLAAYSYPNSRYPSQTALPAGYTPPPPPTVYLPAGITPPNALPTVGYSYPANVTETDVPSATSLTKTYYPSTQSEVGVFEDFDFAGNSNSESRSEGSPLYRPSGEDKQNGFNQSADATSSPSFKPANHGDSLRSLESLTLSMSGTNNGTSAQHFPATSTSVVTSHQHLCLDTNTPC